MQGSCLAYNVQPLGVICAKMALGSLVKIKSKLGLALSFHLEDPHTVCCVELHCLPWEAKGLS